MRGIRAILGLICVALGAGAAWSAEALVFSDGRELVVEHWESRGNWIDVGLPGGGSMSIPADGVEGVRSIIPTETAPELGVGGGDSWRSWAGEFADVIDQAARDHDLEPALLAAVMRIESNFDPYAVSPKGACGLLQLIPATAERFGVRDVFDPEDNVRGGARYLQWLLSRYEGDTRLALAAYNAGENAVDRYGDVPPYRETRNYVTKVLGKLDLFSSARPVAHLSNPR